MVKPTEEQLTIRVMQVDDVPNVFDIERESFNDSPWTIDALYHELSKNNSVKYSTAIFQKEITEYLGLWIAIDQAQITTIAIKEPFRDYRLSRLSPNYVMNYTRHTRDVMSLEVGITNVIAQHVYKKLGFQYGDKRKNHYGGGEDTLVTWVNLSE